LVSLVLVAVTGVLAVPAASAASGTPISIDAVRFATSEIPDGSRQELTVDWSVPGEASNPVTVTVALPEGLKGHADRFSMLDPDGQRAGECVVTATKITCTVDPAYVEGHELDMHGSFTFAAEVWLENVETVEHVFEFGDVSTSVTVTPNPDRCVEHCEFGGWGAWKSGSYQNLSDTISWWVGVPAGADGIPAGMRIKVEDRIDPAVFELVGAPRVLEARSLSYDSLGRQSPVFAWKPASEYTVSKDRSTVEFTSVKGLGDRAPKGQQGIGGSIYEVVWDVKVLDEGKAKTYTNTASWEIEGEKKGVTTGTATRYSGSGTVVGRNFGKFQLTKELTGDTSLAPEFTVRYSTSLDGVVTEQKPITIRAGESFLSEELFKGTTVTLEEIVPNGPANVEWADPVFVLPDGTETDRVALTFSSANGNLGKVSEIRLKNRATLDRSTLGAAKAIVNEDGMRIPADTVFALNYRWAADPAKVIPQGAGTVQLPADGRRVEIPGLPVGAVVDFSESALAAVPGATWQQPVIAPSRVTVGADGGVEVRVANTLPRDRGGFEIVKRLGGDGSGLVDDPVFTVTWSYPADPAAGVYEAGSGTVRVTAGGAPAVVDGLPAGAVVTLEEKPEKVVGGTWKEPVFSSKTFTVVKGNRITVDLDNEITLNSGAFSVVKRIEGTGAGLVPATDTFVVHYEYDAGVGFGAGAGDLVVRADGTPAVSGPLPYGAVLRLSERTPAPVLGGTWSPVSSFSPDTVTIGDGTTAAVTLTNAITRDVGSFEVRKRVEGSGAHLVSPEREYRFTYEYPAGPSWEAAGPTAFTVPGDGTAVSVGDIPAGATVTVRELAPDAVEGGSWGAPRFSAPGGVVTVAKDETAEVLAVNTLDLNTGSFAVRKKVEGSGASLLPGGTAFTVRYAYPAGDGVDAGSGTLTVTADGRVQSDPLPYGAVVTLSEIVPSPVAGADWAGARFSADTVVIGDGTVAEVVLTNTLEGRTAAGGGGLAITGAPAVDVAIVGGAFALVLVGAGLAIGAAVRRRRA